jgi:tetratricopeptide (TPR) repeat protein
VRISRQLAQARPDAFLPDLAMSLNNLAIMLSDLGRREEALAQAEEAVRLYRQLAQARPDAFLPDLARSLAVAGNILLEGAGSNANEEDHSGTGRAEEARAVRAREAMERLTEAIRILTPFFERLPQAHRQLIEVIVELYSRAGERAGVEIDEALLAPVVGVCEKLKARENQSPG